MGWSVGYDSKWERDIGYGVPAICDHPGCNKEIDRGLGYVCGGEPYGGEHGCGLFFCGEHLLMTKKGQLCGRYLGRTAPAVSSVLITSMGVLWDAKKSVFAQHGVLMGRTTHIMVALSILLRKRVPSAPLTILALSWLLAKTNMCVQSAARFTGSLLTRCADNDKGTRLRGSLRNPR